MVSVIWIMTGNGPSNNRLDGKKRASLKMSGIKEEKVTQKEQREIKRNGKKTNFCSVLLTLNTTPGFDVAVRWSRGAGSCVILSWITGPIGHLYSRRWSLNLVFTWAFPFSFCSKLIAPSPQPFIFPCVRSECCLETCFCLHLCDYHTPMTRNIHPSNPSHLLKV